VSTGVESDEFRDRDGLVHQNRHLEQVPEGRHRAHLAIREQPEQFCFGGKADFAQTEQAATLAEIADRIRW